MKPRRPAGSAAAARYHRRNADRGEVADLALPLAVGCGRRRAAGMTVAWQLPSHVSARC
ncbi:hypothetical protein I553_3915 [Mycobacterium xenopi 4042]|uniref:Uncharacterized protein n=1 Tax=Mycobacterium xenopi 4042 TaxID=1299334 RepID=X8DBV2_MYCXE|nr:hypothetical protein I553_3915 [Mycobacterium xenopi 4042]